MDKMLEVVSELRFGRRPLRRNQRIALADFLEQQAAELERLRADAARYRFLKETFEFACNAAPGLYDDDRHRPNRQNIELDDEAIDTAIEEDWGLDAARGE